MVRSAWCFGSIGLLAISASIARADDATSVAAAVGAGGQGDAVYTGVELRLDAEYRGARAGLGGRVVWLDGEFRSADWSSASDAVTLLRYLEASSEHFAIAGGALAPSRIAHVALGYRASLDDRARTGFRGRALSDRVAVGLEIDDVLDPALIGGELSWQFSDDWALRTAMAVDPTHPDGTVGVGELAIDRRWTTEHVRFDLGGGAVVEPTIGMAALLFTSLEFDAAGARWFAQGDARGGTGTLGTMFGPLHRLERLLPRDPAHGDVGAGLVMGVAGEPGWVAAGIRARGDTGVLGSVEVGAPMSRQLQAAAWFAATRLHAAGAAELRVAWARRLHAALQIARMYTTDGMDPFPRWSVTAWFGASTVQ